MTTYEAGEIMIEWSVYCGNGRDCHNSVSDDIHEGSWPYPQEHGWRKIRGRWYCPNCAAKLTSLTPGGDT